MNTEDIIRQSADAFQRLREQKPSVHCITNTVAQPLTANCCTALGLRPSMTTSTEEVAYFAGEADALLINLGTLTPDRRAAIEIAVDLMRDEHRPWVLDPVLVNMSPIRAQFARDVIQRRPAIIRGNCTEIRTLAEREDDPATLLSMETLSVVVKTGEIDRVCSGRTNFHIANGDPMMAQVVGTGCAGAAILAALTAVESDNLIAAITGVLVMTIAGEQARQKATGPGSFVPHFIDRLSTFGPEDIMANARLT